MIKREANGNLLWGVIVETEAYSESEPACHGYTNRTKKNETLFGPPGHFYIYLTYGKYHCVNVVTDKANWANGVLLRAIALPNENERVASGPGLLANKFGLTREHDTMRISLKNGVWLAKSNSTQNMKNILQTTRIGISKGKDIPWRWYLQNSRSISKRAKGDSCPTYSEAWHPTSKEMP